MAFHKSRGIVLELTENAMSSGFLMALVVLLGGLVAVLVWRMRNEGLNVGKDSYEPAMMLDVTEQRVYRHLLSTFPDRFVMAKVPLQTVVQVERSGDRKRARERMDGLVAQFAVCGPEGLAQIVFEMETPATRKSVNFEKQLKRKYALLKNAGVPMVRVKSHDIPAPSEFRKQLDFAAQQRTPANIHKPAFNTDIGSMPMGVTTVMNGQNTPVQEPASSSSKTQQANTNTAEGRPTLH
jgi:Protein of unknown function (DUF2726)